MGLPATKSQQEPAFHIDRRDMGRADTLRYNVLSYVVEENYDRAISELKSFFEKDTEYPKFKEKVERYINHAVDLVNAIRAKRKFPGVNSLPMAKQQELTERFHQHFSELQYILKKIEKIQYDLKLEDVRSTIYVVRTIVYFGFAIAVLAFVLESTRGLGHTAWMVIDDYVAVVTDWVSRTTGL